MEPRVLAGGVKTVENGRVDRVFEIVRPRFSGRWGNISLYVRRWTGSVRGSSLRLVFTLLPRRSCFVQPDGGLAGVGVTLGRFNDAGLGSKP